MAVAGHRQLGELSGGQGKRVFLARALAQEMCVIVLDEPFTGVGVRTDDAIIAPCATRGRRCSSSSTTYASMLEFCDSTVLICGTVLAHGPKARVFTRDNLSCVFGGVVRRFMLGGTNLHDDREDTRQVTVISDDERPFVVYHEEDRRALVHGDARDRGAPCHPVSLGGGRGRVGRGVRGAAPPGPAQPGAPRKRRRRGGSPPRGSGEIPLEPSR